MSLRRCVGCGTLFEGTTGLLCQKCQGLQAYVACLLSREAVCVDGVGFVPPHWVGWFS